MKENRKSVYQNRKKFPHLENYAWASHDDYDGKQFKEMSHLHKRAYLFALKWGLNKEVGRHRNALDDALNTINEGRSVCIRAILK